MMLHGINVALAYGGQEALWKLTYEALGVTDAQLDAFFNGPAYLSWSRGQGQAGVGGPLPAFWFQQQLDLNKGLVAAMVAAGVVPVLPAFQGNVPLALRQLFPAANISAIGWLDVFDPLFARIADTYTPLLRAHYPYPNGTLWYEADGLFSSGTPPWAGPQRGGGGSHGGAPPPPAGAPPPPPDPAAAARSAAAFHSFARHDSGAVWVYQSWIWRGFSSAKDWAYGRGWVSGAPPGRLFLLDQTAERVPIWSFFGNWSFDGQPFAWLSMNNMGGNEGLVGALEWVRDGFAAARAGGGGALAGVGLDPEGINTMPAYWMYVLDRAWEERGGAAGRADPAAALGDWGVRRCGAEGAAVRAAWAALGATVFSPATQGNDEHHLKYCGTALPLQAAGNGWNSPMKRPGFPRAPLAAAWAGLLDAAPGCAPAAAFDLVDVAREFLASFPCVAAHDALLAARDDAALDAALAALRGVLADADALLGAMRGFLLGEWLADAAALGAAGGATPAEAQRLLWNARAQVTTWFPTPPAPDNHL
jgi:alpha-N-acetylglucosaminidase